MTSNAVASATQATGYWPPPPPAGPPTLLAAIPDSGPATGGNLVRLIGQNLRGATSVTFGGVLATIVYQGPLTGPGDPGAGQDSPQAGAGWGGPGGWPGHGGYPGGGRPGFDFLVVIAPANPPGTVQIIVTTPAGTSNPLPYTYLTPPPPPPTPTAIAPTSGPSTGGTAFTITGTNLGSVTGVLFNGVPATGVTATATTVTGTTPPGTVGPATVTLLSPAGNTTVPGGFTYLPPAPTAASIIPAVGPVTGSTPYVLTGTHLTGVTSVTFGATPSTILFVNPAGTQLVGLTPAGPVAGGNVTVTVTGPGGSATVPGGFTYFAAPPPPAPAAISPTSGTAAGGTAFTLTGTGLGGTLAVLFNGVPATGVTATATTVTGTTPPGTVGPATVTVVTASGTATVPGGYTYT
ncbi:IPT/TIG domain-containing protein [Streptomyces rhizoryzae]|uniref:IPT/TIG domain-containing protein n=1 Tax=Streptomyces rhizoryzae TaxID=2932493 RepID=UPI0027E4FE52|nr:IPT/TIG domain-containing protein [Streptomyces rhizoryzae]